MQIADVRLQLEVVLIKVVTDTSPHLALIFKVESIVLWINHAVAEGHFQLFGEKVPSLEVVAVGVEALVLRAFDISKRCCYFSNLTIEYVCPGILTNTCCLVLISFSFLPASKVVLE